MKRVREESVEARALATAAEQLLAELGVTEPGAGRDNHELPAGALMDALYAAWNNYMRARYSKPDAIFEPEGRRMHKVDLDALEEHYNNAPLWDSSMDPVYSALPALIAELRELRAEVERLREDAARARWCEENKADVVWDWRGNQWRCETAEDMWMDQDRNAAIDYVRTGVPFWQSTAVEAERDAARAGEARAVEAEND